MKDVQHYVDRADEVLDRLASDPQDIDTTNARINKARVYAMLALAVATDKQMRSERRTKGGSNMLKPSPFV